MTSGFGDSGVSNSSGGGTFPGFPVGFGIAGTSVFHAVTGIAKDTPTVVVSYTVPSGKSFYLQCVAFGGNNIAEYTISVASDVAAVMRTWFSGPLYDHIRFDGVGNLGKLCAAGAVVQVSVTHKRDDVGDFEAVIVGTLQ